MFRDLDLSLVPHYCQGAGTRVSFPRRNPGSKVLPQGILSSFVDAPQELREWEERMGDVV